MSEFNPINKLNECHTPEQLQSILNTAQPKVSIFGGRKYSIGKEDVSFSEICKKFSEVCGQPENISKDHIKETKNILDTMAKLEQSGSFAVWYTGWVSKDTNMLTSLFARLQLLFRKLDLNGSSLDGLRNQVNHLLYEYEKEDREEQYAKEHPEYKPEAAKPQIKTSTESVAEAFKLLGLEPNATRSETRKAFHKLALEYHPDKTKGPDTTEQEAKMKKLNDAKEIIAAVHPDYF